MNSIKTKSNFNRRSIFLFGLCCLSCVDVSARNQSAQLEAEGSEIRLHFLRELRVAEQNFTKAQLKVHENEFAKDAEMFNASDLLSQARAFVGDTTGAISIFEWMSKKNYGPTKDISNELNAIKDANAEDAILSIVRAAKDRQIVVLNESHHVPMHRAFASLLAKELRKIGYEYLACEALNETNSYPFSKGELKTSDGYYINEPVYANFIRDAIRDNWKFVSYDINDPKRFLKEGKQYRKSLGAQNISDRILRENPNAKIFMLVGLGNAAKLPESITAFDRSQISGQIKRLTGIDPLVIDQTAMFEQHHGEKLKKIYAASLEKHISSRPFVLIGKDGKHLALANGKGYYDIEVVHPRTEINVKTGRPSWYAYLDNLTPHDVPFSLRPQSGRRLVYVYNDDNKNDQLPIDVVLLEGEMSVPKFLLPTGNFKYEIENEDH